MISRFVFAALLLAASFAHAELEPKDFVVKVTSTPLTGGARGFEGSGVVVHHKGKTYILTSEHVVLHDATGLFARNDYVSENANAAVATKFLQSDFGLGLALLEIEKSNFTPGFELTQLSQRTMPAVGSAAWTVGFPYGSRSIVADPEGHVQSTTTESAVLAEVPKMIQSEGAHAEFGMSGGALIDDDLNVIGILSHEIPDTTKTVFSIPIQIAAQWALRVLEDPTYSPHYIRTGIDRIYGTNWDRGKGRLRAGPFLIEYRKYDGYGEVALSRENAMRRKDPLANKYLQRMMDTLAGYLPIDGHIGPLPRFQVYYFRPKNLLDYRQPKLKASNLVDFLRKLELADYAPMAYQEAEGHYPPNEEYAADQFHDRLQGSQYGYGPLLSRYLSALVELTDYSQGPNGSMDRYHRYGISYVHVAEIDFILNDASLAADWEKARREGRADGLRQLLITYRDNVLKRNGM